MKRNTDYQFIATDASDIESYLISAYETITGTTVYPASPERLFIAWVANIVIQERVLTNITGNQNIPSRATGLNLDALAELFYASARPTAKAAHCTVRFNISQAQTSAILIPTGTRVTDRSASLYWETQADSYIAAGSTYADVQVICQTVGTIGNGYDVGQINSVVDLPSYYVSCSNTTVSDGGADAASDDEFYEILRALMDAYSTAGPVGAYEYHAKAVSTAIADVAAVRLESGTRKECTLVGGSVYIGGDTLNTDTLKVYTHGGTTPATLTTDYTYTYTDNLLIITPVASGSLPITGSIDVDIKSTGAGNVTIYVLMDDGTAAGSEIKSAVLAACSADTVRPLTDNVTVADPTTVSYNIDLTYYIGATATDNTVITDKVQTAVNEYIKWQSGKLGRDINPSYLIGLLMQTGIKRVDVRSPSFTVLKDGTNNDVPELAQLGTKTIVNGGTEVE